MNVKVWQQNGATWDCESLTGQIALNRLGQVAAPGDTAAVIQPVPAAEACGAIMVPDGMHGVSHCGIPLSRGMQLVNHGDYLDFADGRRIWLSIEAKVTEKKYVPEVDGEDLRLQGCLQSLSLQLARY